MPAAVSTSIVCGSLEAMETKRASWLCLRLLGRWAHPCDRFADRRVRAARLSFAVCELGHGQLSRNSNHCGRCLGYKTQPVLIVLFGMRG